jgi:uracil-DNA glycosylase family 4
MTVQYLFDTINKHENCIKCELGKLRISNNEKVSFGTGMVNAKGLIIVPKPRFSAGRMVGPYSMDSEEVSTLKSLWSAIKMDPDDWYITSAIGCKTEEITDDHIRNCRDRLGDIVSSISPRVVVCFGRTSLRAFAGDSDETKAAQPGLFDLQDPNIYYKTYLTYDITQYIQGKARNVEGWQQIGNQILEDWKNIKALLND